VSRRLLLLLAGAGAFWVLAGIPARHFGGGDTALIYCGTALLLCVVPAAFTLAWSWYARSQDPFHQVAVILGGTGVRTFGVLFAFMLLHRNVPFYHQDSFLLWVLAAYVTVLALEVVLLLVGRPRTGEPS
jgi:hypothetical protein